MRDLPSRGEAVAVVVVAGALLALLLVLALANPPLRFVDGASTIRQCRPAERPDTTLCYRPATPEATSRP